MTDIVCPENYRDKWTMCSFLGIQCQSWGLEGVVCGFLILVGSDQFFWVFAVGPDLAVVSWMSDMVNVF